MLYFTLAYNRFVSQSVVSLHDYSFFLPSNSPSIHPSLRLSVSLSVRLSICRFVCLPV